MEKFAWKGYILGGQYDEYVRRHDAIWPEMTQVLNEAGIHNYSIWRIGDELFGYYECDTTAAYADAVQAASPVVARWNEYMKNVMVMEKDPETGAQAKLVQVFEHK